MSSREFAHWIAYYKIEPFGFEIENFRYGTQTAALVNAVVATIPKQLGRPRPKPFTASDYYPETARKKTVPLTPKQREHLRRKRGRSGHGHS